LLKVPVALVGEVKKPDVVLVRTTTKVSPIVFADPAHVMSDMIAVLFGLTKTLPLVGATSTPAVHVDPTRAPLLVTTNDTVAPLDPPDCWIVKLQVANRTHDRLVEPGANEMAPGTVDVPWKMHAIPFQT
jgi:hypothetical protein